MIADDEVTVAKYAKDRGLLNTPGWKALKRLESWDVKLTCLIKQAKLRSFWTAPKYMYWFWVPATYEEALEVDKSNGNTKWADAIALEMQQLKDYSTFTYKEMFAEEIAAKAAKVKLAAKEKKVSVAIGGVNIGDSLSYIASNDSKKILHMTATMRVARTATMTSVCKSLLIMPQLLGIFRNFGSWLLDVTTTTITPLLLII